MPIFKAHSNPLSYWNLITPLDSRWPGAVRPIWQDEATKLREVKSFAQGHTAHLLSEQRESGLLHPNSFISGRVIEFSICQPEDLE